MSQGRQHAGILLVPFGPIALVELRIAMLVAWMETFTTRHGQLLRWHDLQGLMTRGFRLDEYTEHETRQAMAIDPLDD